MFCRREEALLDIREEADPRACRRMQIDPGGGMQGETERDDRDTQGNEHKVQVIGDGTNTS